MLFVSDKKMGWGHETIVSAGRHRAARDCRLRSRDGVTPPHFLVAGGKHSVSCVTRRRIPANNPQSPVIFRSAMTGESILGEPIFNI